MRTRKQETWVVIALVGVMAIGNIAVADTFGTGANQFTIDFVNISGATNPASGYGIVNDGYRMGSYEITNDQWDGFKAELGVPVTGNPSNAYQYDSYWTDPDVPTNMLSWYEAAQFVNWLNTSTGHQAAYKFTGTQGTGDYTFDVWSVSEAAGGMNLYRHKDASYFLPTEDEWVKAAYWNGTSLQDYATRAADSLHQSLGVSGTGWNYYDSESYRNLDHPWDVGSGSEELNGTFDMMGNICEWLENAYSDTTYRVNASRGNRGGSWFDYDGYLKSSYRDISGNPSGGGYAVGFRVASVPEPATLSLLALGGLVLLRKRKA